MSQAEGEAAIKQAKSASEAAAQLMKKGEEGQEEHQQQEANVSNEIKELKEGKTRKAVVTNYSQSDCCTQLVKCFISKTVLSVAI